MSSRRTRGLLAAPHVSVQVTTTDADPKRVTALDFMKIDRSFVADVCRDRRSAAVVPAAIELAHAHDLFVIAESVETADQLEALRAMQCDLVQGFHLGRPMTVADRAARVTA
jgi:EAL domain-containing protein (putative c-di-GMP-specific phosphodiesterase class I)